MIQYSEVMREFSGVIPWLDDLDELRFATNGRWFRDELLRRLGQKGGQGITPYQFVDGNDARTYVGGILHFDQHPERLTDHHHLEVVERLTDGGSSYISCLQVRPLHQGLGSGTKMMRRAVNAILDRHGAVWGVVSDPLLLPWYQSLGARLLSARENRDNLWIVYWTLPSHEKTAIR